MIAKVKAGECSSSALEFLGAWDVYSMWLHNFPRSACRGVRWDLLRPVEVHGLHKIHTTVGGPEHVKDKLLLNPRWMLDMRNQRRVRDGGTAMVTKSDSPTNNWICVCGSYDVVWTSRRMLSRAKMIPSAHASPTARHDTIRTIFSHVAKHKYRKILKWNFRNKI
jgi:hypothetical protein